MIELVTSYGERDLFVARVADLGEWPSTLEQPKPNFVVLVAVDARELDGGVIGSFAEKTLGQGAAHVCAWGPDCERVHDVFDETARRRGAMLVTTWHADDTLDEALWYALFVASPDEEYVESCTSLLAVVVGNDDWAEQVRRRLSDPDDLTADVAF